MRSVQETKISFIWINSENLLFLIKFGWILFVKHCHGRIQTKMQMDFDNFLVDLRPPVSNHELVSRRVSAQTWSETNWFLDSFVSIIISNKFKIILFYEEYPPKLNQMNSENLLFLIKFGGYSSWNKIVMDAFRPKCRWILIIFG